MDGKEKPAHGGYPATTPEDYRIGRIVVNPGDIIVIKFDRIITDQIQRHFQAVAAKALPKDTPVLILDSVTNIGVLTINGAITNEGGGAIGETMKHGKLKLMGDDA